MDALTLDQIEQHIRARFYQASAAALHEYVEAQREAGWDDDRIVAELDRQSPEMLATFRSRLSQIRPLIEGLVCPGANAEGTIQ